MFPRVEIRVRARTRGRGGRAGVLPSTAGRPVLKTEPRKITGKSQGSTAGDPFIAGKTRRQKLELRFAGNNGGPRG